MGANRRPYGSPLTLKLSVQVPGSFHLPHASHLIPRSLPLWRSRPARGRSHLGRFHSCQARSTDAIWLAAKPCRLRSNRFECAKQHILDRYLDVIEIRLTRPASNHSAFPQPARTSSTLRKVGNRDALRARAIEGLEHSRQDSGRFGRKTPDQGRYGAAFAPGTCAEMIGWKYQDISNKINLIY